MSGCITENENLNKKCLELEESLKSESFKIKEQERIMYQSRKEDSDSKSQVSALKGELAILMKERESNLNNRKMMSQK